MNNLEDLKKRIERAVSELDDLLDVLEKDIADPEKAVSMSQLKAIATTIEKLKNQRLPVPAELKGLKLTLLSKNEQHKERLFLRQKLQRGIRELKQEKPPESPTTGLYKHKSGRRKQSNYERPLGARGYTNLEDYLIPVIKLMWNGKGHNDAFRQIADKLDVRYNTVSAQCTRTLGLTTDQFVSQVNSRAIIRLLRQKYPDQYDLIKDHLDH